MRLLGVYLWVGEQDGDRDTEVARAVHRISGRPRKWEAVTPRGQRTAVSHSVVCHVNNPDFQSGTGKYLSKDQLEIPVSQRKKLVVIHVYFILCMWMFVFMYVCTPSTC